MENLKKNLNAQTHVFGNFQFSLHKARNHLVVHKMYKKFGILLNSMLRNLVVRSILTCLNHF